jgi:hypothetical protein
MWSTLHDHNTTTICRGHCLRSIWEKARTRFARAYVSRCCALLCLALLLWGNAFVILGHAAGPDGQLFRIGVLGVAAYLAGFVVHTIGLPPLLGMLLVGIVLRNTRTVVLSGRYLLLAADLRFVPLTRQSTTKIKRSKYSMTQTGGDVQARRRGVGYCKECVTQ